MKLNTNTTLFLTANAIALVAVCAMVAAEARQQRSAMLAQIDAKERAIAQMNEATAGIEKMQAGVANLSRAVSLVEAKLAPERTLDRSVKDIWQMAEANSLKVQTVQPLAIARRGNYSEQPVELRLTGDFGAFYGFMLGLEKMPRLMHVTQMELCRLPDQNGSMSARMKIGIFYQPETGETASAGLP